MLLAYSTGLAEPPRAEGDGSISGRFLVLLSAIAQGIDAGDSKALARMYATAARTAILQHPGLDGFAGDGSEGGTEWASHANYQIRKGVEADRNLMGVTDGYLIDVPQILNRDLGIREPAADPTVVPDDPPTVDPAKKDVAVDADRGDVVGSLRDHGFFGNE